MNIGPNMRLMFQETTSFIASEVQFVFTHIIMKYGPAMKRPTFSLTTKQAINAVA